MMYYMTHTMLGNEDLKVIVNDNEAFQWYSRVANIYSNTKDKGKEPVSNDNREKHRWVSYAMYSLGYSYVYGTMGQSRDMTMAIKWFDQSCTHMYHNKQVYSLLPDERQLFGDINYLLGRCYSLMKVNHDGMMKCYKTAADNESINAMLALVDAYYCMSHTRMLSSSIILLYTERMLF